MTTPSDSNDAAPATETTQSGHPHQPAHHHHPGMLPWEIVTALSLLAGRGPTAKVVVELAELGSHNSVIDIGCGTGTALRLARRAGARATGIDPSPTMLWLSRRLTWLSPARGAMFLPGTAEHLPVPDGSATVAWSISSVHHWSDLSRGLSEVRRALLPGGRLVLSERLFQSGEGRHAGHGLSTEAHERLATDVAAAGFVDVRTLAPKAGRKTLAIVIAAAPGVRAAAPER